MINKLWMAGAILVMASFALVIGARTARPQSSAVATTLTLGLFAPTVAFADSSAKLLYVHQLAQALESATGTRVLGRSYASFGALRKAKPDFAIVDAQCYAVNQKWRLLANGEIDGRRSRIWALYSRLPGGMPGLKRARLSYVKTGCRDRDFTVNAMLNSEVGTSYFGGRVGKPTLRGAVAQVTSFKGAAAVFAPTASYDGMTAVFAATSVPGPAFVLTNAAVHRSTVAAVRSAVVSYHGGGAISGWAPADIKLYANLNSKMAPRVKRPVFATPTPIRLPSRDMIRSPDTLNRSAYPSVTHHWEAPRKRQ